MPLRVTRRSDTGALTISGTVRPAGAAQGVRIRRSAATDSEPLAREEAAALEAEILRSHWHGPRAPVHGFAEAVASYLTHSAHSAGTVALVKRLLLHFRDTPLRAIDQPAVDQARRVILRPGASPATVLRNLIAPLRAVMHHAERRGWCHTPPFDVPPQPKGRTRFLRPAELVRLRDAAPDHLRPFIVFLAGTGCRLGEALRLDWNEVDLRGARAILWEGETKSRSRRVVALPPAVVASLAGFPHRDGAVFRRRRQRMQDGRLAPSGLHQAPGSGTRPPKAWTATVKAAGLAGITPHVLRHTWATWHYALHHDILLLARDGGWASTALVERYAHLMPVGEEAAIRAIWGLRPDGTPEPTIISAAG